MRLLLRNQGKASIHPDPSLYHSSRYRYRQLPAHRFHSLQWWVFSSNRRIDVLQETLNSRLTTVNRVPHAALQRLTNRRPIVDVQHCDHCYYPDEVRAEKAARPSCSDVTRDYRLVHIATSAPPYVDG